MCEIKSSRAFHEDEQLRLSLSTDVHEMICRLFTGKPVLCNVTHSPRHHSITLSQCHQSTQSTNHNH